MSTCRASAAVYLIGSEKATTAFFQESPTKSVQLDDRAMARSSINEAQTVSFPIETSRSHRLKNLYL